MRTSDPQALVVLTLLAMLPALLTRNSLILNDQHRNILAIIRRD